MYSNCVAVKVFTSTFAEGFFFFSATLSHYLFIDFVNKTLISLFTVNKNFRGFCKFQNLEFRSNHDIEAR